MNFYNYIVALLIGYFLISMHPCDATDDDESGMQLVFGTGGGITMQPGLDVLWGKAPNNQYYFKHKAGENKPFFSCTIKHNNEFGTVSFQLEATCIQDDKTMKSTIMDRLEANKKKKINYPTITADSMDTFLSDFVDAWFLEKYNLSKECESSLEAIQITTTLAALRRQGALDKILPLLQQEITQSSQKDDKEQTDEVRNKFFKNPIQTYASHILSSTKEEFLRNEKYNKILHGEFEPFEAIYLTPDQVSQVTLSVRFEKNTSQSQNVNPDASLPISGEKRKMDDASHPQEIQPKRLKAEKAEKRAIAFNSQQTILKMPAEMKEWQNDIVKTINLLLLEQQKYSERSGVMSNYA